MNRKDFNKAVKLHSENVFRYAFKWTRNEQDAKDLVQDVFGKLWVNCKKVEFKKSKSWLFTCMHNALVNFSKRKEIVELVSDSNFRHPIMYQPNLALKDMLQKSLAMLSDVQRSIVILRDSEGYSYEEIGAILNLTESQVKVYLFRARKNVKEQIKEMSELVA